MAWAGRLERKHRWRVVAFLLVGTLLFAGLRANPNAVRHDFHVSITQIDYNARSKSLEITCKLFLDDIEGSILALGGGKLRLGEADQAPNADSILNAYLQNRMVIEVNDQPSKMTWIGSETEQDAVWCYLEIGPIERLTSLKITNRILMERFDDQANVVHIQASGTTRSLYLNANHLIDRVSL